MFHDRLGVMNSETKVYSGGRGMLGLFLREMVAGVHLSVMQIDSPLPTTHLAPYCTVFALDTAFHAQEVPAGHGTPALFLMTRYLTRAALAHMLVSKWVALTRCSAMNTL